MVFFFYYIVILNRVWFSFIRFGIRVYILKKLDKKKIFIFIYMKGDIMFRLFKINKKCNI